MSIIASRCGRLLDLGAGGIGSVRWRVEVAAERCQVLESRDKPVGTGEGSRLRFGIADEILPGCKHAVGVDAVGVQVGVAPTGAFVIREAAAGVCGKGFPVARESPLRRPSGGIGKSIAVDPGDRPKVRPHSRALGVGTRRKSGRALVWGKARHIGIQQPPDIIHIESNAADDVR